MIYWFQYLFYKCNHVFNILKHESYDSQTNLNDISIIKLKNEATYGAAVQPACLPPSKTYKPISNIPGWIAGWGTLIAGGDAKDILQNVKITYYYSGAECKAYGPVVDWNKQICAGSYISSFFISINEMRKIEKNKTKIEIVAWTRIIIIENFLSDL